MQRLRSDFFVSAYRVTCEAAGAFVTLMNKGDAMAGAVYIRFQLHNGPVEVYEPVPNLDNPAERCWTLALSGEAGADDFVTRILARDPDAWVVDVEAPSTECRPAPTL